MSARPAARRRGRGGAAARRGAALVVALAALVLLMALALALHAVTLRERRSARRATLARAAMDAAEGALARWQVRLARGEPPEAMLEGAVPGTRWELEGGAGEGVAGDGLATDRAMQPRVRVILVTLGGGVRQLVTEATATAAGLRARRRVSLLLVPDTMPALPGDTTAGDPRPRLVPAPERSWAELP